MLPSALFRGGKKQNKAMASSLRSTPRSSVTEKNLTDDDQEEPGMKRIGRSRIVSGGYQDWDQMPRFNHNSQPLY
jgi:hypothetical protein